MRVIRVTTADKLIEAPANLLLFSFALSTEVQRLVFIRSVRTANIPRANIPQYGLSNLG